MTRILVAGDVCDDEIIVGSASRLSRDTPALPIIDVEDRLTFEGGAAAAYRQVLALGAEAFLAPTGRPALKTRLVASTAEGRREVARFDMPWPAPDARTFTELLDRAPACAAAIYSQYRPGRPLAALLRRFRDLPGLHVGDIRDPALFVGALDVVKVSMEDAIERLDRPRPNRTLEGARRVARAFVLSYGFRLCVVTLGPEGYAAASDAGADIVEGGLPGGVRSVGAGDVFTATLAVLLAEGQEVRDALKLANRAAGLACRKDEHLPTISREELENGDNFEGLAGPAPGGGAE